MVTNLNKISISQLLMEWKKINILSNTYRLQIDTAMEFSNFEIRNMMQVEYDAGS